jgi:protein-S-isoprenylcysteine O-methyltransferase Ste14
MFIPGLEALTQHFPDLQTRAGALALAGRALAFFALTTLFFIATDAFIPDWQPDGQIIVMTIGFLVLARFFTRKAALRDRYGDLAYREAFTRYAVPGLAVIFASVAHCAYLPGLAIPELWWKSLLRLAGVYLTVVGAGLWLRAVLTFGIDSLTMLYVYYPEKSRLVDSSIYGVLRHPVYAGGLRIILGLCLLNGTWQALIFALIAPLGLTGWVRLVEEKELLERFPDYREYRSRVPAFWTWRYRAFWGYLITGK